MYDSKFAIAISRDIYNNNINDNKQGSVGFFFSVSKDLFKLNYIVDIDDDVHCMVD
jgi:hypothetical protein